MHDPLGEFEFSLFGRPYTVNPRENLEVQVSSLGDALQTNATWFAFYAALRDEAQNTVDALAASLQQRQANLYVQWQEDGSIKLTELSVKENTRADSEYQNIQEAIVEASLVKDKLASFTKAFEERRYCLVELAKRNNNSTYHDMDATPRNIRPSRPSQTEELPFVATKGVGKHPSQKGK